MRPLDNRNGDFTKCMYCGKSFITEEWWSHPCIEVRRLVKHIVLEDFSIEKSGEGTVIHAWGIDGKTLYTLTKPTARKLKVLIKEREEAEAASTESLQRKKRGDSTGDLPEPPPDPQPGPARRAMSGGRRR